MTPDMIFIIIVIIFSAIIHEVMHGVAADRLGDPTARDAGRLTLNPLPHIDLYGSIVLPFIFVLANSPFVFGWAKPVPYNHYNLRDQKYGAAKIALAGPASNFAMALAFGLLLRFFSGFLVLVNPLIIEFIYIIVGINLILMEIGRAHV